MWSNWTLQAKDLEVEKYFVANIATKLSQELSTSTSGVIVTLTRTPSCLDDYKKFTCYMNYPPCDPTSTAI